MSYFGERNGQAVWMVLLAVGLTACFTDAGDKADEIGGCTPEASTASQLDGPHLSAGQLSASQLLSSGDICGTLNELSGVFQDANATTQTMARTTREEGTFWTTVEERSVQVKAGIAWRMKLPTECHKGIGGGDCVIEMTYGSSARDAIDFYGFDDEKTTTYAMTREDLPALSALADVVCNAEGNPTTVWGEGQVFDSWYRDRKPMRGERHELQTPLYKIPEKIFENESDDARWYGHRADVKRGLSIAFSTFDIYEWSCENRTDR